MGNDLCSNLDKLRTTALGVERIRRNLGLGDIDVVAYCKDKIKNSNDIIRQGKNWYAYSECSQLYNNNCA